MVPQDLVKNNLVDKIRQEWLALWPSRTLAIRGNAEAMAQHLPSLAHDEVLLIGQSEELEMWRLVSEDIALSCLDELVKILQKLLPAGLRFRLRPYQKAYLVYGQRIEIYYGRGWVRIGHCGLLNPMLLIDHGFDSVTANGLVLNVALERCAGLRSWQERDTIAANGMNLGYYG